MHQQHLLPHQFQQHNWLLCINSISSFIKSSSTTGCNASTALAHTLIPAAQLDHLQYLFPAAQLEQYAFPAAQLEHLHYSFPVAQLEATPATVLAALSIPAAELEAMPATALANSLTLAAKPEETPAKSVSSCNDSSSKHRIVTCRCSFRRGYAYHVIVSMQTHGTIGTLKLHFIHRTACSASEGAMP
jgi:hypothetical protein